VVTLTTLLFSVRLSNYEVLKIEERRHFHSTESDCFKALKKKIAMWGCLQPAAA
jgi:hypothetical protein